MPGAQHEDVLGLNVAVHEIVTEQKLAAAAEEEAAEGDDFLDVMSGRVPSALAQRGGLDVFQAVAAHTRVAGRDLNARGKKVDCEALGLRDLAARKRASRSRLVVPGVVRGELEDDAWGLRSRVQGRAGVRAIHTRASGCRRIEQGWSGPILSPASEFIRTIRVGAGHGVVGGGGETR